MLRAGLDYDSLLVDYDSLLVENSMIDTVSALAMLLDSWPIVALQIHSIVPMMLIGTLWYLASQVRRSESTKQLSLSTADKHSGRKSKLPPVSIVLPTRGYHQYSADNWTSILEFKYSGHVRYSFVVESLGDPSVPLIRDLQSKNRGRDITVICAGESQHCSQKNHNLIHGIRYCVKTSKDSNEYILCMDDDVQPHAGFLESLVSDMERMPDVCVATAYPFDIPHTRDASLFSYATLAYHLPLSVGLAISTRTKFVWGGCMAFRMEDMAVDRFGIMASWSQGGYSDDLTVAARLGKLKRTILCPSTAVFPQWIPGHVTMKEYWNYLRRQLFVLDTYSDVHNKLTNYSLICLFIYGSVGFVGPTITIPLRVCVYLYQLSTGSDANQLSHLWWLSVALFCIGAVYMTTALQSMVIETARLLGILHASDSNIQNILSTISWSRLFLGFWLSNLTSPVCLAYTLITRHIVWSGITYVRANGKVTVYSRNECS